MKSSQGGLYKVFQITTRRWHKIIFTSSISKEADILMLSNYYLQIQVVL